MALDLVVAPFSVTTDLIKRLFHSSAVNLTMRAEERRDFVKEAKFELLQAEKQVGEVAKSINLANKARITLGLKIEELMKEVNVIEGKINSLPLDYPNYDQTAKMLLVQKNTRKAQIVDFEVIIQEQTALVNNLNNEQINLECRIDSIKTELSSWEIRLNSFKALEQASKSLSAISNGKGIGSLINGIKEQARNAFAGFLSDREEQKKNYSMGAGLDEITSQSQANEELKLLKAGGKIETTNYQFSSAPSKLISVGG
jgi:chromosome segregation ATPase